VHGNLGEVNALAPIGPAEILASLGVSFRLHEHPDVTSPVEVCAALGVPLERTVKTLAFVIPEDRLLLAALPGHARLRYGALARAAGVRRGDLSAADAGRLAQAGMQPGGVCPVSADRTAVVVFDGTVSSLGRVHCGSGRPDSSIEIEAAELMAVVPGAATASIAALPADGPA
jgi:Cys-tRNA(Pro)/Cys-tRNA(Cys) deacylase